MKQRKMIVAWGLLPVLLVLLFCSASFAATTVSVNISIDFEANLIFSKYDVDLYVNDTLLATLTHGKDYSGAFEVNAGENTLYFYKHNKKTPKGSIELNLTEDTNIECHISCHSGKIKVDKISIKPVELENAEEMELSDQIVNDVPENIVENNAVNADNEKEKEQERSTEKTIVNTELPTPTATVVPTELPTPTATVVPTESPTSTATVVPTELPTPTVSVVPTAPDTKSVGGHHDESLTGKGVSDYGRDEPQYVNVIGYVTIDAELSYELMETDKFQNKKLWIAPIYERNGNDWKQIGTIPHSTEVVVRKQFLTHDGWGFYSGYLLVEKTDDGTQFYINVNNYITKPYWTYQSDLVKAASTGLFVAKYKQKSAYKPYNDGEIDIPDGTVVLVVGTADSSYRDNTDNRDIDAIVWKKWRNGYGGVSCYFNHEDLEMIP